jgi:hypothetical protein
MDFAKYFPATVAEIEVYKNVPEKHGPFCLEDYSYKSFGTLLTL